VNSNSGAQLAEAHRAMIGGDLDRAAELTDTLLAKHPNWAGAVHLSGLIARRQGDLSRAEDLMRRSLDLPGVVGRERAEYANNLGNLLSFAGFAPAAEAAYRLALESHSLPEATLGLARTLLDSDRADEALAILEKLPEKERDRATALLLRSEALSSTGESQRGLDVLTAAPEAIRNREAFWISMGARLVEMGRLAEAEMAIKPLLRGPAEPGARIVMAKLHETRRDWESAVRVLAEGLTRHPHDVDLLSRGTALAWMLGDSTRFADRLRHAVHENPDHRSLRLALFNALSNAGRQSDAENVLCEGLARQPDDEYFLTLLALRCAESERVTEALQLSDLALARSPELELVRENAAIVSLVGLRSESALEHTQWLIDRRPLGQSAWALRVLALRLAGDPAWMPIADPSRVCSVATPPPPNGFETVARFNKELASCLRQRHTLEAHPLLNSVRGGTQIEIHLASETDAIIRTFFDFIHPAIDAYIRSMPEQPGHPMFGRKTTGYRLTGCWTVRLTGGGGSHVNHIHPKGWISSAYYLNVPSEVTEDPARGGWLAFGQPPYPIPGMGPLGWVTPEAGRLALFPSYQWHGVQPFIGDRERLTIAFDVVPTYTAR
jgi:predicted Zn-dependent protease